MKPGDLVCYKKELLRPSQEHLSNIIYMIVDIPQPTSQIIDVFDGEKIRLVNIVYLRKAQ